MPMEICSSGRDQTRRVYARLAKMNAVLHFQFQGFVHDEHIPELIDAWNRQFSKIEGRMKTALYVATVARTYRKSNR